MKNQLQINSYLGIVAIASLAFVAETTYFLYAIPMNNDGENWLPPFASWATAFFGQCGIYLTILCPTAAHALSGRWSWSVRILTAVSMYCGGSMAMLTVNAYEDARGGTGSIRTSAELYEGAMLLATLFMLYFSLVLCTFVWIATRGRRFGSKNDGLHFDKR